MNGYFEEQPDVRGNPDNYDYDEIEDALFALSEAIKRMKSIDEGELTYEIALVEDAMIPLNEWKEYLEWKDEKEHAEDMAFLERQYRRMKFHDD